MSRRTGNKYTLSVREQSAISILNKKAKGQSALIGFATICWSFDLKIHEWAGLPKAMGAMHEHSSRKSLHFVKFSKNGYGRAFDAYGKHKNMVRCAIYIKDRGLSRHLTEGIFNSGQRGKNLSVKYGQSQLGQEFWGYGTWVDHKDHIHIAI